MILTIPWPRERPVYQADVHLEVVAGRFRCVGIKVESLDGERAVTGKTIGPLISEAIRTATYSWILAASIPTPEAGDGLVFDYNEPDEHALRSRAAWEEERVATAKAELQKLDSAFRPTYTDADYRWVADSYETAFASGRSVQAAVARDFGVNRGAAGMLIRRARLKGFLPATERGVARAAQLTPSLTP